MSERIGPVLSPVDYDAWERGYMPPSEHILIDQLAYRGARVIMSNDWGKEGAWWFVVRGALSQKARLAICKYIMETAEFAEPEPTPNPTPLTENEDE